MLHPTTYAVVFSTLLGCFIPTHASAKTKPSTKAKSSSNGTSSSNDTSKTTRKEIFFFSTTTVIPNVLEKEEVMEVLDGIPEFEYDEKEDDWETRMEKIGIQLGIKSDAGGWKMNTVLGEIKRGEKPWFQRSFDVPNLSKNRGKPNQNITLRVVRIKNHKNFNITGIEILSCINQAKKAGESKIRKGGLGDSFMNFYMRSNPGEPLHYKVKVYGRNKTESEEIDFNKTMAEIRAECKEHVPTLAQIKKIMEESKIKWVWS